MTQPRPFDVVLYGATGFTGRLAAEYLARQPRASLRWAMAGRSLGKLRKVRAEIGAGEEVTLIQADSNDPASLVAMAGQTQVVLTTVGPYIRYGEPLVKATIEAGADYVDITGEPEFVNIILDRYDVAARERGVRIVNCCGFDSIPHDLGVYMVVQHLPDEASVTVKGYVSSDASFSGDTWHSAIEMISRRGLRGPKVKSPAGDGRVVASGKRQIHRSEVTGDWVAPFPTIDPQVILRSARSLPIYGREFRYSHYLDVGSLPKVN